MALVFNSQKQVIKVVSSKDSSVKCSDEDYEKYAETLDESYLRLEGEPTRFLLRSSLDYKGHEIIMDKQTKMGDKGKVEFSLAYILSEVRMALVGIENPESLPKDQHIEFKRESDGYASKELIASLQSHGVVMELFKARQSSGNPKFDDVTKKN